VTARFPPHWYKWRAIFDREVARFARTGAEFTTSTVLGRIRGPAVAELLLGQAVARNITNGVISKIGVEYLPLGRGELDIFVGVCDAART
jgi:hypothetical protein